MVFCSCAKVSVYLRRLPADPREIGEHDAASCPPIPSEQCIEIIGDRGVRVVFGHLLADGAGLFADGFEDAELMEVPDEVLAPVAGADEGDVRS